MTGKRTPAQHAVCGVIAAAGVMARVAVTLAQSDESSVYGVWLTQEQSAHVELYSCAEQGRGPVCGRLVKLIDPTGPDDEPVAPEDLFDVHNPDPALRSRQILGMVFLYDFKPTREPNSFEDGSVYNAEDGKVYRANIALQANGTLRLRGYVGIPLLGRSEIWTRVR
ncbi:DUF2147 domain-containing protein [Reyranella sp. CPCC 100927]|uniref:DUF2147 domain-containing protein n=1 Tax=Reyranella sp. CPCC 100927 TaxID=2599616 RepID=UPI0015B5B5D1|nr:DUF2147 domain-containing protein [Reyranella sp. CPCC 100927]